MDLDAIFNSNPQAVAGGAALGDMLTGGPGRRAQGAYVDQFGKNAKAADAMWQARDNRARAIAREGLNPEVLGQAGYDEKLAPLLANVLAAGATPNLRNLGDFANPADRLIDAERAEALKAGDIPRYNRMTALATDKAYQPARVTNGNILPDGVGLGDEAFQMVPLPQTLATIEQKEAQTQRTQAQIGNDAARTGAYVDKQHRAPAPRSGGSSKPATTAQDEAAVLRKAREAVAAGASVEAVRKRMKDRGYGKLASKL